MRISDWSSDVCSSDLLFGPETEAADAKAFAERTQDDRHHFRFIVSPEDAPEMSDLKTFARELMGQMEKDLGTKLDWVGVDHWNTDNPHVHIILRGRRSEEHTSELQSLMRISYAVFCLKKTNTNYKAQHIIQHIYRTPNATNHIYYLHTPSPL